MQVQSLKLILQNMLKIIWKISISLEKRTKSGIAQFSVDCLETALYREPGALIETALTGDPLYSN